jgi:epoxyqueuosine reductase
LQWDKIARYARGLDYHLWLKEQLTQACELLKANNPDLEYLVATDSKPILERDLAKQAGLGWIGKNTCLIHPEFGSYFFIGEALLSAPLESPNLPSETGFASAKNSFASGKSSFASAQSGFASLEVPDFCGTCTACIEACPTKAIEAPRKLNATKCLAYWNIEAKTQAPENLRDHLGEWFFGCDICQEVCPWNKKFFRKQPEPKKQRSRREEIEFLKKILSSSNREIQKQFGQTPLIRARASGLKRNAILVAVKIQAKELLPEIERLCTQDSLQEIARWAIAKLNNKPKSATPAPYPTSSPEKILNKKSQT